MASYSPSVLEAGAQLRSGNRTQAAVLATRRIASYGNWRRLWNDSRQLPYAFQTAAGSERFQSTIEDTVKLCDVSRTGQRPELLKQVADVQAAKRGSRGSATLPNILTEFTANQTAPALYG